MTKKIVAPSVAALLVTYNELASNVDAPTIAKWNGTKAKLIERIDALRASTRRSRKSTDTVIALADIARDAGVNPKVARAKLRRLKAAKKLTIKPATKNDKDWVFNKDDADAVAELIRS